MLEVKTLAGYKLQSLDGEIGKVREFYFDDRYWTIRYLVADTGSWLTGRQVLISPYAMVGVSRAEQHIMVDLTKKQIESSPSLSSDEPISKQFETDYYGYYGYPTYWASPYMWGAYPYIQTDRELWNKSILNEKAWDPYLRSTHEVTGYHIQATDGAIGHVEDFILEEETWAIRYLVIDTRNWWPGKKILVSPQWIDRVSWNESKVFVNLSSETIKQSPEYQEDVPLTRDDETRLHGHYHRPGYWETVAKELAS